MQTLNKLPEDHIFHSIVADELGYGADGQVFSVKNNDDMVLKISILYEHSMIDSIDEKFNLIKDNILYIQSNAPKHFAKVCDFEYQLTNERDTVNGPQKYIVYSYWIEKLNKISDDEKKVFHTIMSHEDLNKQKKLSKKQLVSTLKGLARALDFDVEKVILFHEQYHSSNVIHNDVHPRNIMKDNLGNFKLIDIDNITI
jgi:serine/threonine protein kinase